MKLLRAWWQAARFPSQIYLLLPVVLGQLWARHAGFEWHQNILFLVLGFALLNQLYIVFANDYADLEVDQRNENPTFLSGGSRVLVEKLISPRALLMAALAAATGCCLIGVVLAVNHNRPWSMGFALAAIVLLWAYSFAPLHASYKGFGVFLQMLGIGVVLPLFGYYAQAGTLAYFPVLPLAVLAGAQLACAMATALPDLQADQMAGKRTLVVRLGTRKSQLAMACLLGGATCTQALTSYEAPGNPQPLWVCIPLALAVFVGVFNLPGYPKHGPLVVALAVIGSTLGIEFIYIAAVW